ncbi:MAG: hypothetical protein DWQ47_10775 [Acidobacteria bacterium]|nr:MAG: hypothetical protein DWQ32_13190 [Acidobacteriota bacterium]REJ98068.1 MAG: hypothetical protein DWQ38_15990 [Acidobacteriota bacterium]REK16811.1 MAG: hypothetical protein DWQ43_01035 [Acidobacteriota bacterium]REK42722.1 MAG: hypothetical protein DWQ47_10775 [Acidobacteriota bacterium]
MRALKIVVWSAFVGLLFLANTVGVYSQQVTSASALAGKWQGTDNKVYTIKVQPGNEITLTVDGADDRPEIDPNHVVFDRKYTGAISQKGLVYQGAFNPRVFDLAARIRSSQNLYPGIIEDGVVQQILARHPEFRVKLKLQIVDAKTIKVTRYLTSIYYKPGNKVGTRGPELIEVNEKEREKTVTITKEETYIRRQPKRVDKEFEQDFVSSSADAPRSRTASEELELIDRRIENHEKRILNPEMEDHEVEYWKGKIKELRNERARMLDAATAADPEPRAEQGEGDTVMSDLDRRIKNHEERINDPEMSERDVAFWKKRLEKLRKERAEGEMAGNSQEDQPAVQRSSGNSELDNLNRRIRNHELRIKDPEMSERDVQFWSQRLELLRQERARLVASLADTPKSQ